jgi:hypothetical protein
MVKSEVENGMEVEVWGLVMVVCIFAAMRNLLDDSGFVVAECKLGSKLGSNKG